MSVWTWWLPSKEAIDKVVETQEDEEVREREQSAGRKAKINRFYKRRQLRNKHICSHT
jgi:hypothetical protein